MKDKEYCFDFVVDNKVSIISNYLYFNNKTLGLLNNPNEVIIGLDKQNKAMLIKTVDARLCAKKYKVSQSKVYCVKLINQIKNITDKKVFNVVLDRELGGLLIELGD